MEPGDFIKQEKPLCLGTDYCMQIMDSILETCMQ